MTLENLYKIEMQKVNAVFEIFDWSNRLAYANWCAQTYYFVSHSTRLLSLVAARTSTTRSGSLHHRFLKHSIEESGHEKVMIKDLAALDCKIETFPELNETKNFYQTQYYLIDYTQPYNFFGYILCLEGIAVEQADRLAATIKKLHSPKAATFLSLHGGEDPEHLKKAFESIESLDAAEVESIKDNFSRSCANYIEVMNKIMFLAGQQKNAA